VIANIERAANLFLVKNVYSLVLALIIVFTASAYPLAPIQLTVAALVVMICSLWVLLVLARPPVGWKILLVAGMAGVVAVIVAVPALVTNVFLLHPTPLRILVAAIVGSSAAFVIELAYRSVAIVQRHRATSADG
jgi:hypothetical protein